MPRLWCPPEGTYPVDVDGYLALPQTAGAAHTVESRVLATEELAEYRCLILLGEPGAGKTWTISTYAPLLPSGVGDSRPVLHRRLGAPRGRGLGAVPAAAFPLDQLMLGHRHRDFRHVEHLAALHPGDRTPGQARPAPAAAARLMPQLPVRPGHLRQRRALMPILAAGPAPGFLPQRPRPRRRLVQPFAGRWPGGIPRCLPQARRSAPAHAPARPGSPPGHRARPPVPGAARPPARPALHPPDPHRPQTHPDATTAPDRKWPSCGGSGSQSASSRPSSSSIAPGPCLHLPSGRREASASHPMSGQPPLPGRRPIPGQRVTHSRMAPPPGHRSRHWIDSCAYATPDPVHPASRLSADTHPWSARYDKDANRRRPNHQSPGPPPTTR